MCIRDSTNIGTGPNGLIRCLAIEDSGDILVGGDFTAFNGSSILGLARLDTTGTPDPGFSVPFNPTAIVTNIHSVVAQADGKIMAGGQLYIGSTGSGFRSGVARLNANGSRDTTFDPDAGAHETGSTSGLRRVYAITQLNNGQYVLGGSFTAYDENAAPYLLSLIHI